MNAVRAAHLATALSVSLGVGTGCEKPPPAAPSVPSAESVPGALAACGSPGQPRCPLQEWMRATLQAYLVREEASNLPRISAALDKLASVSPAEYSDWGALARRGSEAARRHDFPALKEACAGCHDAYRTEFRGHMRGRRLF